MKYPIFLLVVATVTFFVGVGIRLHADWRYTNKMYYHTIDSTLYEFEDVFAERNIGDTIQFASIVAIVAAGSWFAVVKISRNRKGL